MSSVQINRTLSADSSEYGVIRLGDAGAVVELTVKEQGTAVDISTATNLKVYLKPPKAAVIEKTGTLISGGTTGKFGYTLTAADLQINAENRYGYPGRWKAYGRFTLGSWSGRTSQVEFVVEDVLDG